MRDAYVLRLVGNRWGPVLKSEPPVEDAAQPPSWSTDMERAAARPQPRTRRFTRKEREEEQAQGQPGSRDDVLRR